MRTAMRMRGAELAAVLVLGFLAPAFGQGDEEATAGFEITPQEQAAAVQFAIDNMGFVLAHQAGHLLLGEFGLAPPAQPEGFADTFAALTLLDQGGPDAVAALQSSADAWRWTGTQSQDPGVSGEGAYLDVHNPDRRRAEAVVCLAVGRDRQHFATLAGAFGLSDQQQAACGETIKQAIADQQQVLQPIERSQRPDLSGAVATRYEPGGSYQVIADALSANHVLERAAEAIGRRFAFPRPVTFVASSCGQENAFYDPEAGSITLCYELADAFVRIYVENVLLGDEHPNAR